MKSVPSPVRNLREWNSLLDHQSFFDAVTDQFLRTYGGRKHVQDIDESQLQEKEYVKKVYEELQTWEWQWGQTPEFTNSLTAEFAWGTLVRQHTQSRGTAAEYHLECRDNV